MRTVKQKNLLPLRRNVRIHGTEDYIYLKQRDVIVYGQDTLEPFDEDGVFSPWLFCMTGDIRERLAAFEGFDGPDEMLEWFTSRNYTLPQPFFLYEFVYAGEEGENQ
ncbi:hypothetical protein G3I44_14175 [Halogeometricum borinquense]|uniref:Uncharacterized protein n=1 Tax=Halogeometricum borinquense TaxID=60847 RepID=A0A6C0UL66_9EURY|nr:hypothetical protein [Halogeometricum borinquense]QIB75333.1 hypothetical protein G3I44_14175 [Halogeometricum borinquense]